MSSTSIELQSSEAKKAPRLGGKVILTGIGGVEEDEFMFNLLNEQGIWNTILLGSDDEAVTRKRFLSRSARYSGLLNLLNFTTTNLNDAEQLSTLLSGADAWIAFDVPPSSMGAFSQAAINAGIKRVMFTTTLPQSSFNVTHVPELEAAAASFAQAGLFFTGIRHGDVIPGDEDFPYEIANSTTGCAQPTVERGVLARVAAELLKSEKAYNQICGVSSSGAFADAYLKVLRSSGLTRQQEMVKMFSGGLQRVEQLTVAEYEAERKRAEEKRAKEEARKAEEAALALKEEEERLAQMQALPGGSSSLIPSSESEIDADEFKITETDEEKIVKRTDEILQSVWREFQTRMYTKSTSKLTFFESNRAMARGLAEKEFEEERKSELEAARLEMERKSVLDRIVDSNRKQYSKLLAFERKEMQNQKDISDTWVKYIYLLLEVTMAKCKADDTLFHNLDEFSQTLLLRQQANKLRDECGLPNYEVVYDPLDASVIVNAYSKKPLGMELGIDKPAEVVIESLNSKYGKTIKSVAALRGASQIIELAIETLRAELPPPPPSVNELRRAESTAKREGISKERLDRIRNRGKPAEEENVVGRF